MRAASTRAKMAVFAPMLIARTAMVIAEKPGAFRSDRTAYRRSCQHHTRG